MDQYVVVTVCSEGFSEDFQLPSKLCMKELCPRLLKVLQSLDPIRFKDYKSIILEYNRGLMLEENATLEDYGVFSGSYLEVKKGFYE